jgi:hypothetical protein
MKEEGFNDMFDDFPNTITELISNQTQLINLLMSQVVDLSMMSKIELGDDVIEELRRLKEINYTLTNKINKV